ncbi:MAG: hypothetical protein MJ078_04895, partial [Clostridia bacterium]|nr:hypothetical protein [Clostridia bacterium]
MNDTLLNGTPLPKLLLSFALDGKPLEAADVSLHVNKTESGETRTFEAGGFTVTTEITYHDDGGLEWIHYFEN